MQLALSSVLCCPLCLFSPVPSLLSFPRAGCMPAPWHLCLTSGEQEKVEASCPPSSHLKLVLFLLLSDKVLEQNIAALCRVSVDRWTLGEAWARSTVVLLVQNCKSQESGGHGVAALLHCSFSVAWRHQGQVWEPLKDWHKRLVRGKINPFPHLSLLKLCSSLSTTFCSIMTDSVTSCFWSIIQKVFQWLLFVWTWAYHLVLTVLSFLRYQGRSTWLQMAATVIQVWKDLCFPWTLTRGKAVCLKEYC